MDKYRDCLAEVPKVRKELGYPPLVTPTSQIVGTQAVFNVLIGERYKVVPTEVKNYVLGYYGRPPAPIDPEVQKKIIGDEQPITVRPADLIEPGLEKAKKAIAPYLQKPEDILSQAIFPQVAPNFLKERLAAKTSVDYNIAEAAAKDAPEPYYPA